MLVQLHDGAAAHALGAVGTAFGSGAAFRYTSLAVRNMPVPLPADSRWYKWVYNTLQDVFANPDKKVN